MAKQKGRLLRIKIGDGGDPESFTAIAGAREDSLSGENGEIDITNKDSSGFRELLAGGTKSISLTVSGVMDDNVLLQEFFDGTITNYEIDYEGGSKIAAAFQVRSFENTGAHDDAVTFSGTLESSGTITFTP